MSLSSRVTDLATTIGLAVKGKQDVLVSGDSIKTVNGYSILGSGNIVVTATSDFASITGKPTTLDGYGITDAYTKVAGKGLSTEDYTSIEKTKLAGIAASANNYSLPIASASVLGGVKAGANITIDASGVISASASGGAAATETTAGIIELATTAEAQAGTDAVRAITPLILRNALNATGTAPIYACRAWVNFNGTETVAIRASGNVSSITDNGVGIYTVNFTTAMPDSNYSVFGIPYVVSNQFRALNEEGNIPRTVNKVTVRGNNQSAATSGVQVAPTDLAYVSVSIFR